MQRGGFMEWKYREELPWHRWFAWYPVKLDNEDKMIWLVTIERRRDILWYYRCCI